MTALALTTIPRPAPRARQERWAPRAHGLMRDPRLLALSDGAVRVYAALVDGPEQSYLRGLLDFSGKVSIAAALAAVVPQTAEQIDKHLDDLRAVDLIALDRARLLVYVPACQAHVCAAPQSVQALTATLAQLAELPQCPLMERVKADLLDVTARAEEGRALRRQQQPAATIYDRLCRALASPLRDVPAEEATGQLTLRFPTQITVAPMDEHTNRGGAADAARARQSDVDPAPVLEGQHAGAAAAPRRRDVDREATRAAHVAPRSAGSLGDGQARHVHAGPRSLSAGDPASVFGVLPSEVATLGPLWRRVAGLCPALDGGLSASTPTGLSYKDQAALARGWVEAQQNGFSDEDLLRVGEWVQAGQCWATDPIGYVVGNLCRVIQIAKKWDQEGRKTTRGTVRQQQQEAFAPMLWQGGKR